MCGPLKVCVEVRVCGPLKVCMEVRVWSPEGVYGGTCVVL